MGYTIELEYEDLRCRSPEAAKQAAAIITADPWMYTYHLAVGVVTRLHPGPGLTPCLEVENFQGDHWHDENARKVWLAIASYMAEGASIEFRGEGDERWRIHWEDGRAFEEYVKEVIWSVGQELTPPPRSPFPKRPRVITRCHMAGSSRRWNSMYPDSVSPFNPVPLPWRGREARCSAF
jgi:hypothetical protein